MFAFGITLDVSHFCIFCCQVMDAIFGPERTEMGSQGQKGVYISYESLSII
jgi:hypothetical protein